MTWAFATHLLVLSYASLNQEKVANCSHLRKAWFWLIALFLIQGVLASGEFVSALKYFLFGKPDSAPMTSGFQDQMADSPPGILPSLLVILPHFFFVMSLYRFSKALIPAK